MQTVFTVLIVVQFLVVALHDLVDIPGWTYGRQVQSALGRNRVLIGALISILVSSANPANGCVRDHWHEEPIRCCKAGPFSSQTGIRGLLYDTPRAAETTCRGRSRRW